MFGVVLATEMSLQLPPATGFGNDWKLVRGSVDVDSSRWSWYHQVTLESGEVWSRWAADADGDTLIYYPDYCDFVISPRERTITTARADGLQPPTLQHLLIDQIVPLALALDDYLVLHASAVVSPRGACAFLGRSGQGKSTLATYLSRNGWSFVTDDALRIVNEDGVIRAFPGTPRARLWPDSAAAVGQGLQSADVAEYTYKQNVEHVAISEAPYVELARVFLIGAGDGITIEPVAMRDALMEIATSSFRVAIHDRARLTAEFRELERLVKSGYVRRLRYPRDYSRLGEVAAAIETELSR